MSRGHLTSRNVSYLRRQFELSKISRGKSRPTDESTFPSIRDGTLEDSTSSIPKTERHEIALGDTERCSPFPARCEATHVARRSFVIRQIAFLPAASHEKSQVRVSTRERAARAYTRVPGVVSCGRIRARKIIIILTARADDISRPPQKYLSSLPINSAASRGSFSIGVELLCTCCLLKVGNRG